MTFFLKNARKFARKSETPDSLAIFRERPIHNLLWWCYTSSFGCKDRQIIRYTQNFIEKCQSDFSWRADRTKRVSIQ